MGTGYAIRLDFFLRLEKCRDKAHHICKILGNDEKYIDVFVILLEFQFEQAIVEKELLYKISYLRESLAAMKSNYS